MRPTFLLPLFVLSALLLGADNTDRDKAKMTGCLTKDTGGEYVLTGDAGKTVTAMGSADLAKHAMNHKVTLHGTKKSRDGKTVFHVDRVDYVADSCVVPTPH